MKVTFDFSIRRFRQNLVYNTGKKSHSKYLKKQADQTKLRI